MFSRASWSIDKVGLEVATLVIERLVPDGVITLVVDDTLHGKGGKHVFGAGMHHDALASTRKTARFKYKTILRKLPSNLVIVGKLDLEAALYGPCPKRRKGQRGRPRKWGARVPNPTQLAENSEPWLIDKMRRLLLHRPPAHSPTCS